MFVGICYQQNSNVKVPRKINANLLRDPSVQKEFADALTCLDGVNDWETLRDTLYRIGKDVLGFVEKKHQDWFDENDTEISQLLSEKRFAESQLLVEGLTVELKRQRASIVKSLKSKIQNVYDKWKTLGGTIKLFKLN